jgi:hypothetical protein
MPVGGGGDDEDSPDSRRSVRRINASPSFAFVVEAVEVIGIAGEACCSVESTELLSGT